MKIESCVSEILDSRFVIAISYLLAEASVKGFALGSNLSH